MTRPSAYLCMMRGDDFQFDIFVTDGETGDPVDITGTEFWFTAKGTYYEDDVDAEILKDLSDGITILDAVGGQARVLIDAADTDGFTERTVLRFDVQWRDDNGFLHTLQSGDLIVELDVTRRTT